MTMENSRVFYAYTPHHPSGCPLGVSERATVAVRLNKKDNLFEYGISICGKDDNFSKKTGRHLAIISLENGYGTTIFGKHYQDIAEDHFINLEKDGTEKATIKFVNDLANGVHFNMRKYKRRLGEFNKKYKI